MRLIDADELKEWVKNWLYKDSYYFPRRRKETIPASELYDVIDQVPTVQAYQTVQDVTIEVPVRHGRWTADESTYTDGFAQCSVCKTTYYVDDLYCVGEKAQSELPIYCPHCGAKMTDGEDG